ncbi:MAG: bacteriohemerythrin [Comamonadaceae bacterium]
MSLQWREQLGVGNDLIDNDHKHLIAIINQAEDTLQTKNMSSLKIVLNSLADYSKFHFAREELVAAAAGFPQVTQLHESHEALMKKLNEVSQELETELSEVPAQHLVQFLRDWLINHVIKEDLMMKPFLARFSPKFDPRK